jgi:hypothetical protein
MKQPKQSKRGYAMATEKITIEVDAATARLYEAASEQERRKIDALLDLKLNEVVTSTRPLEEVMRELSEKAQARGLTPEILKELLRDD